MGACMPQKPGSRAVAWPGAARGTRWSCLGHLVILYVRSPEGFLDDSTLVSPFLPRTLTKPRTVCFCQPVADTISSSVAPVGRVIMAITSAFLLLRSAAGLWAAFWMGLAADFWAVFFAALAALARFPALAALRAWAVLVRFRSGSFGW